MLAYADGFPLDGIAMKFLPLALLLLSPAAFACDTSSLPLSGIVQVDTCHDMQSATCVYATKAVYEYGQAVPDTDEVLTILVPSSPWHLFDSEMRIVTIDAMVAAIRPKLTAKVKRVELIGSWTGVSPVPGAPSLAQRLSRALDGMSVKGEDGFLWLSSDGSRHTTHQAYSVRDGGGSYFVPKGRDVFVSLASGWPAGVEDRIPADDLAMRTAAAAGWEILFLCPDRALAGYESTAEKGGAIAAYNAAIMRLERNGEGDRDAALKWLERAAALGDAPSRERLAQERPVQERAAK